MANEVVNNPVNLTLTNGSVWNVVGEANYLGNVVVDSLDSIKAEAKTTVYTQSLTVDGAPAAANVAFDYHAFTYITFEANAKDGWEIVSVTCSDPSALSKQEDGTYRLDDLSAAENTVTVTVKEAAQQGGMPGGPGGDMPGGPGGDMPGGTGGEQPTRPEQPTQPEQSADAAYVVKAGDTLSGIAKAHYGDARMWKTIYEANESIIKNSNLIYPGQKLILPAN